MSIGYADTHPTLVSDQELPRFTMRDQKRLTDPSPPVSRTECNARPHTPNFVPNSGSSHTMIESRVSQEALVKPTRPPSAHTRGRSDPDIVDDILGYYDDSRSQRRSRTYNATDTSPGVIWVKNEVSVNSEERGDGWPLRN